MAFENTKKADIKKSDSDFIGGADLVGEIVAVDLIDYDKKHDSGKYKPGPRATVDLIVITGEHKGLEQANTYFSGNLGKQIEESIDGEGSTIIRITSGPSAHGHDWIGIEEISDREFEEAQAFVQKVLAGGKKKKGKNKKKKKGNKSPI